MNSPASVRKRSLPRTRRVAESERPPLRLTERDLTIVSAVHEYRFLTAAQIVRLLFAGKEHTRAPKRLKRLYHHGFLGRLEQRTLLSQGSLPFVYYLDSLGAELLAGRAGVSLSDLPWRAGEHEVGQLFLDHTLAANDVRIAVTLSVQENGFTLVEWIDERTLKSGPADVVTLIGPQGGRQRVAVVPDGYFVLKAPNPEETGKEYVYPCFLELDRATVSGQTSAWRRRSFARTVRAYIAYFQDPQYSARYGTSSGRVLTVTTGGERRMQNLKQIATEAGGKNKFWFCTWDRIEGMDILTDEIWEMAGQEKIYRLTW